MALNPHENEQADSQPSELRPQSTQPTTPPAGASNEPGTPILRAPTNLEDLGVSADAWQLADQMGLIPHFQILLKTAERLAFDSPSKTEQLERRLEMLENKQRLMERIEEARMQIDFVMSALDEEQNLYSELIERYEQQRDRKVSMANLVSFGTNGILWVIAEALTIPTYKSPRLSIPSGTIGALAGIVPTGASYWAWKQVKGGKFEETPEQNMLAKLFGYDVTSETEYPELVWRYLNSVPPGSSDDKTRKEKIIDRWVSNKQIPARQDESARKALDVITGSASEKHLVTIRTLGQRRTMLQQLGGEIFKMNRLLLELIMVLRGSKFMQ